MLPPRLALLAAALVVVTFPAVDARAADPEAPPRSPAHWLPGEAWVSNHWLPFDERRLYRVLGIRRGAIWNQLRDDRRSIAQLARRRGWSASRLARALVAPWRGRVTASRARLLRTRARRVITQGHLAQHILFHSLHQFAVPNRSARIFGVERDEYLRLRRSELSPVQIGMLYGRSPAQVQAAVIATLRERARAGVRTRSTPPRQARLLVGRQLSQVPRWLQQARYNGPPKTHHHGPKRGQLVEKPLNYASNPAIAADGSAVAYESYEQRLPLAVQLGEINVFSHALRSGLGTMVSRPVPGHPRSAYNATTSADGRFVAYEVSAGNLNFAKRYGKIAVELHDTSMGATTAVGPPAQPQGQSRSAFNPSLSGDGRRLAFSAAGGGGFTVVWMRDTDTGATTLATPRPPNAPPGDAYGGRISGDGGSVVFAWVPRDGSRSVVYLRDLGSGTTRRVSPAGGSASHPAISRDATVVAFSLVPDSRGSSRAGARIYLSDVKTGVTRAVSRARDGFGFEPALSADGRQVAYTAARGGRACVLRYDAAGGTEPVNPAACGRGVSFDPSISADGNRVAFTSTRRDLAATRSAGARSIYVRDLATGATTLVSDGFDANGTP